MSDDNLPGFIEDEPKKPTKPAAEPGKGFNAFADVKVGPDATAAPAAPAKPATTRLAKPAVAAKPSAAEAAPAKRGFDAFADAASQPDGNDADVKPGSGKDLWACPHCGAKNKPERNTCRTCAKSPTEAVVIPWHAHPLVKPAIGIAVLVVVIMLGAMLFSSDVRLVEATDGNIDSKPRTSSGMGQAGDLEGSAFTPRQRYALCGRLVGMKTVGSLTTLVVALGSDGKNKDKVDEASITFTHDEPSVRPDLRVTVLHCYGQLPSAEKGEVVSLLGDMGSLDGTDGSVLHIERSAP
jgi:hypothetical protein